MKVIEMNEGRKIPYEVKGTKICFDDDLTINLSKRQEDWNTHIDVCSDKNGALVIGAASGNYYVAQIDIPKREYEEIISDDEPTEAAYSDDEIGNENEMQKQPQIIREPKPLDMDSVTLTLWALENYTE